MEPLDPNASMYKKLAYFWTNFLHDQKSLVLISVVFGAISAGAAGFGVPFVLKEVFPIVFGEAPIPVFLQPIVNYLVSPENQKTFMLWAAALFLPFIMLFKGTAAFFNVYYLTKAGLLILEKLRLRVFARLQELPLSFHEKHKRGDLLSKLIHQTQFLQEGIMSIANDLVIQPLTLLAALGYLVYSSLENEQVPFLLMNIIVAFICVPVVKKLGTRMLKSARNMLAGLGDITATIQENLTAQRDIRAFGLEKIQIRQLQEQIRDFFDVMMRMVLWQQAIRPAIEIVSACALAFSLYLGSSSGLTLSEFSALAAALYYCYEPIKKLGVVHNGLRMAAVMMDNVNSILFAEDNLAESENPVKLDRARGIIKFDNVQFAYDGKTRVLNDINIAVPEGQIVALVGPSGSGKTTFINLLCRFYDVNEGAVTIDGIDVRQLAKADLRRNIGLVSQHPVLFRGTIKENIALGSQQEIDDEVIYKAGNLAFIDEFTENHPDGYNRELGECGEGLSGGQRQRVSIARSFVKNSPIIILDEATASLDMTSEEKIQLSLLQLTEGRTTFIIAHRFSTIRHAHRILVFEKGHIVADGTHENLYASSPLYKDLYDMQMMN